MKKSVVLTVIVMVAIKSVMAASIILPSVADTYVDGVQSPDTNFFNHPNDRLRINSHQSAPRAEYAYLRFDLQSISQYQAGSVLSLTTASDSNTFTANQAEVWGLLDLPGNTNQNWDATSLTYNATGSELSKPVASGVNPLDESRVVFLGYLTNESNTTVGANEQVSLAGFALDDFLLDQWGSDGLATFIVANRFGTARGIHFNSSRAEAGGPSLAVIPEPSAIALAVGVAAMAMAVGRRRQRMKLES